jgi:hypothetical protein
MPNHCSNNMYVSGSEEDIAQFVKDCITTFYDKDMEEDVEQFDFNSVIPMPEVLEGTRSPTPTEADLERYEKNGNEELLQEMKEALEKSQKAIEECGYGNWYDWRLDNWGTKWNSYGFEFMTDVTENSKNISFTFDTAWAPPSDNFIAELSGKYPNLSFEMYSYESGMEFAAHVLASKGDVQQDEDADFYEIAKEEFGYEPFDEYDDEEE